MLSDAPTDLSLPDLVDRRAELLGRGDGDDLEQVTLELGSRLADSVPRVRRIAADEPGDLVERLVAAEPVHPFRDDADLADRLADDRRCFVLEHPSLPGRPLNVVWVALRPGIATALDEILDPAAPTLDPQLADTAVFYSIWNVEPGLVGIPGGSSLLGGAIDALRDELPGLVEFVTLSPIPGFRAWWEGQDGAADVPAPALAAACARYLTSFGDDGRLLDAVARFHLGNGARLLQLNSGADRSARGLSRSYGLMANYHYEPEDRVHNRSELEAGRPVVGPAVAELIGTACD